MAASRWILVVLLVVSTACTTVQSARILGVVPFHSKSHQFVLRALFNELASRGHEMTVITPVPQGKNISNYREITFKLKEVELPEGVKSAFDMSSIPPIVLIYLLWSMGPDGVDTMLSTPVVKDFIRSDAKFDLVIAEAFFNDAAYGFAHRFDTPLITMCPYVGSDWMEQAVGNPSPLAYVPDPMLHYDDNMSFLERAHNALHRLLARIGHWWIYVPRNDALFRKHFTLRPGEVLPPLWEVEAQRTSLVFLNSHFSINYARPLVPGVVQVAGLHIKPPRELPKDLKKYLDEATNGVVYFSMGSNLRSADFPVEKRDALLAAFGKLKQRVLWKFEDEKVPGTPANVRISSWLPQNDVLAHPNVRVFITHGGMLSAQEAIYHGVPLLAIPIFGDQHLNARRAELGGYGVQLDYTTITEHKVTAALEKLLGDETYRLNARRLSKQFLDRPQSALESAVFWTEYVIRHKGAPQLRSAATNLAWYQLMLLDVLGVLLLGVVAVVFTCWAGCKRLCRKKTKKD